MTHILVTNDDGVSSPGLLALKQALEPVGRVSVIAPDSNRSATARSITTRSPLWAREVEFGEGATGFATDGTPVDCVRFAELGLLEERPELIVSGINHGSNLGDDITYSGTVAAALEGIVLGIPAVAVSQQAANVGMGWFGREFDFEVGARFTAELVRALGAEPMPPDTLININCPSEAASEVEVTHLGKRLYNDELRLVEEEPEGGRRYEIYGFEPSFEDEDGSDLSAVAQGRISVTPVHFDLTDRAGMESLRGRELGEMLVRARAGTSSSAGEAPSGR